jgi:uncharacterized protein YxjI
MSDSTAGSYALSTVELTDTQYEVTQPGIQNTYTVRDSTGAVVVQGKQKLFKMKEEFPFVTGDDEPAFTVKAGGIMDVAGTYTLTDDGTGDAVVVLDEDWSFFVENWTIRDPETGDTVATIRSKNKMLSAVRHLVSLANLIPNTYEIRDPNGSHVGSIDGQFSLRDTYTVTIDDASTVPKEAVIATACVLDALENK